MKAKDVTKKLLADACDDLNTVMKLDPPIPTDPESKDVTKATLEGDLKDAAVELQPDDVLKPKTVEVLRALEIEIPKAETAEEVQAEKKEEKIAEKAPKAPTKVTEKAPEKSILSKFTRIQAVGDALANAGKEGISREDLVVKSDAIYANKGGKANPKEAKWAVKLFLDVLNSVSLIKETEGKFGL